MIEIYITEDCHTFSNHWDSRGQLSLAFYFIGFPYGVFFKLLLRVTEHYNIFGL